MSEPLPPELEHFVHAEASAPVTTRDAQRAVRAKLGATLGIATVAAGTAVTGIATGTAATGTAATGTATAGVASAAAGTVAVKSALAIKLAAVVLTVGAGTVATTVVVTRDREAPRPVVMSERAKPNAAVATPRSAIRVEPIEDPVVPPVIVEEPQLEPPRPRTPAKRVEPPAPAAEPARPSQSQLLADASRSLSQGNAARALELIEDDTRANATGPLAEEREALRISTLVALDRIADAQAAARNLLATYPSSIHRRLAEQVLAKETP
jgi:hypothetical protein